MAKRFKHFADLGITREDVLAKLRESGDPMMLKIADNLAKKKGWTPDKIFGMLADFLGKDPTEILK